MGLAALLVTDQKGSKSHNAYFNSSFLIIVINFCSLCLPDDILSKFRLTAGGCMCLFMVSRVHFWKLTVNSITDYLPRCLQVCFLPEFVHVNVEGSKQ